MVKNTESRTQGAKPLMERAEIMAVARGAKRTENTNSVTSIRKSRKVGEVGMNDIEEAISYIENTKKHLLHLGETWYADYLDDAIELLKEQEAKTVIKIAKRFNDCDLTGFCPFCHRPLIKDWAEKYCGYCGNPVLWEGR